MQTRVLFLDDSGKPDANHPSAAVVIAGFSIPADAVPTLARRVLGTKASYFPQRGQPTTWEVKAGDLIKPNPWKRSKNRHFAFELVCIVSALGGTIYSAAIDKSKMKNPMTLTQTMRSNSRSSSSTSKSNADSTDKLAWSSPTGHRTTSTNTPATAWQASLPRDA